MKRIFVPLVLLLALSCPAQKTFVTGKEILTSKLHPTAYKMTWYMQEDTMKMFIADVITRVSIKPDTVYIVQNIQMKGSKDSWVDSTVASMRNFRPIYHSSYNQQRDMVVRYKESNVEGSYNDKRKGAVTPFLDTVAGWYFDSNIYPHLLAWLPLRKGYTSQIPIYNFGGPGNMGIFSVSIKSVTKDTYTTSLNEVVKVYSVDIVDGSSQSSSQYLIGQKNRKTYKITTQTSRGKMVMQLVDDWKE